jgi:hypothetical protein
MEMHQTGINHGVQRSAKRKSQHKCNGVVPEINGQTSWNSCKQQRHGENGRILYNRGRTGEPPARNTAPKQAMQM